MISTKQFLNVDGTTKRFLSDFIIASDQHVRVFKHSILEPTINDLVSLNDFDLIDNSVVFYTAPESGSIITFEVATSPEEFGNTISLPAADRAENAANAAEGYALQALTYKNQAGVYSTQSGVYAEQAHQYAIQAGNFQGLCVLSATDASGYATQAYNYKVSAELAYTNTAALEASFTSTATGAITIANQANTKSDAAVTSANSAVNGANYAMNMATTANNTSNSAVTTANSALATAETAESNSSTAVTTANSAVSTATEANTTANAANVLSGTANTNATNALTAANSKVKTYRQASAPTTGLTVGDVLVNTSSKNSLSRYNGTSWDNCDNTDIAVAITTANSAYTLALNAASKTYWNAPSSTTLPNIYNGGSLGQVRFNTANNKLYVALSDGQIYNFAYDNKVNDALYATNVYGNNLYAGSSSNAKLQVSLGYAMLGTTAFGSIARDTLVIGNAQVTPAQDNNTALGSGSYRWTTVFASTGTINTSDERTKQQIDGLNAQELAVARKLKNAVKTFKFNDSVAEKGTNARIHIGVIAQEVKAIFESEGLVAENYAIVCYDEWNETLEDLDENGNIVRQYSPAGNRYGIRYEELLAFIISAL